MNWKVIIAGGVAMYVAQFLVSFITGAFIHEGVLNEAYLANASYWRPELNQVPPDMAALMPLWITTGLIGALILAAIYSIISSAFSGSFWLKGAKYGLMVWMIQATFAAGLSGVFNLPYNIWAWWMTESLVITIVGGVVLGLVVGKLSNDNE